MNQIKLRLQGTAPILMHRDVLANPLHPLTKAHKVLTKKRVKTDEDHEMIARSEWRAAMYYDDKIGPFVPGVAVQSMLVEASKLNKLGTTFKRGLTVLEDKCKLNYTGSRNIDDLDGDADFVDCRSIRLQKTTKLMRYRPVFRDWSIDVTLAFNSELLNQEDVIQAAQDGGAMIGLLDYRPTFGRFNVEQM